jgi:hypothetical protein
MYDNQGTTTQTEAVYLDSSSVENLVFWNDWQDNPSAYIDNGNRNIINGISKNGSNDPESAGVWNGVKIPGVFVKWDDGGGNHYLSTFRIRDGQWWDIPLS